MHTSNHTISVIQPLKMIPTNNVSTGPFCSFCLRERPSNTDFYKHVIGSSQEMRSSFQSMLGYDFNLTNFTICKPCWKMVQLVQDFRLRCFKANEVTHRISRGLTVDDGWFSVKNLATIESVRMTIVNQAQQIGKVYLEESSDQGPTCDEASLESEIIIEEIKVEANISEEETTSQETPEKVNLEETSYDMDSEESHGPTCGKASLESEISIEETKVANVSEEETTRQTAEKVNLEDISDEMDSEESQGPSLESEITIGETNHSKAETTTRETPEFQCSKCQKIVNTKLGLYRHKVSCGISNYGIQPTLKEHFDKHGTIEAFPCTLHCSKIFFSVPARQHHERICGVDSRTSCRCEICGGLFGNRYALRKHELNLHAEKVRPCKVCGKTFGTLWALKEHKKSHISKVGSYPCEFCRKKYKYKKSLHFHIHEKHES